VNGQPSVSISVSKRTGTNTLEIAGRVKAVIAAATAGTDFEAEDISEEAAAGEWTEGSEGAS
jgi:multidrug efflux pump subunit AcrB